MRVTKAKLSSKCKDGSLVKEYILNSPINDQDLSNLKRMGEVLLKDIGGNKLFTFSSNILTLKGMIGDTMVYATHRKEDTGEVDQVMDVVFS